MFLLSITRNFVGVYPYLGALDRQRYFVVTLPAHSYSVAQESHGLLNPSTLRPLPYDTPLNSFVFFMYYVYL